MENSQSTISPISLLLCTEIPGSLEAEDEEVSLDCYEDEYIKVLLDKEISKGGLKPQDLQQKSCIQGARLEGINYILTKRELLGFGFRTAYASVSYLDRFISIRDVEKPWAVRLLSMGCLSLAAKMEEKIVPPLSEFCVGDYFVENSVIQRMELLILNTLEWEMGAVTPFDFIRFFADKFCNDDKSVAANAFSRSVQVVLGATRDAKIMCHKPSVIAAAATLFVLDQGLKKDALEMKISPLNSTHSFNIESIISCYGLLQEMEIARVNLSKDIKSPDLSPMHLPYGSSSVPIAKRKRLVFNQDDEKQTDSKVWRNIYLLFEKSTSFGSSIKRKQSHSS